MIALACLGFWLWGIGVGSFAMWLWHELRDDPPIRPSELGRCGDAAPLFGGLPVYCRLPHGHPGWHRGDDDSEWTAVQSQ